MNPANKSDKPGKAPCGMDLVPIYEEEQPGAGDLPAGTVKINPDKQQTIGVKIGEAAETDISKTIRAVGLATYDETKVAHVHTKFPGWVDKVYVDFVGKLVKKGQPLLSIYSPDLVSTQQELLIAKKSRDILESSEFGDIGSRSGSLYNATRERLKYWDISDSQINRIERQGTPLKSLTLYSALDGFVVTRNVFPGQQVAPEADLFVIADLSNIWIQAEVYEYEIQSVSLGQKASVSFPSFPGKTFTGKVTYISPEMDPKTRTLKIRVELANPDFKIKPDMYANVELKLDYGKKLSIPQEAVLDSGADQMVFIAKEGGYFEPRKITVRPARGWPPDRARRPQGRRAGGDVRKLPDRFGEPAQIRRRRHGNGTCRTRGTWRRKDAGKGRGCDAGDRSRGSRRTAGRAVKDAGREVTVHRSPSCTGGTPETMKRESIHVNFT